jgi:uncharacterized protein YbjT (DUF2867 family)
VSIAVFGSSGATGQRFIAAATRAGIPLRLHYRSAPDDDAPPGAIVVIGSLEDPPAVRETLRGTSAAVVLIGPRSSSAEVCCAAATRAIVDAMRMQRQRRLLCTTGASLGPLPGNVSVPMRATAMAWRRLTSEEEADDRAEQERIVRASRLDWTLVKPSRLTDNGTGERYRAHTDLEIGLRSTIARDTLAAFLLSELLAPTFVGQAVYVTGTHEDERRAIPGATRG